MHKLLLPFLIFGLLLMPGFSHAAESNGGDVKFQQVTPSPAPLYNSITDPLRGSPRAPIVMVEYADFQCPFCKQFQPVLERVMQLRWGKVSWVFRHYPLTTAHPLALSAAIAADCAFRQGGDGAFWKYANALFTEQTIEESDFRKLAGAQKLKTLQFSKCIANPDLKTAMEANRDNAKNLDIPGTPRTYLVNRLTGEQKIIDGVVTVEEMTTAIDAMRKTVKPAK